MKNYSSAFTLLELVVTTALVGIMAAIGISQFSAYKIHAYNATAALNLNLAAGIAMAIDQEFDNARISTTSPAYTWCYFGGKYSPPNCSDANYSSNQPMTSFIPEKMLNDPNFYVGIFLSRQPDSNPFFVRSLAAQAFACNGTQGFQITRYTGGAADGQSFKTTFDIATQASYWSLFCP